MTVEGNRFDLIDFRTVPRRRPCEACGDRPSDVRDVGSGQRLCWYCANDVDEDDRPILPRNLPSAIRRAAGLRS